MNTKIFRSQHGMSVVEFVVVAPVLLLCLYAGLEINDRIDAKNALLASVRQMKSVRDKPFEQEVNGTVSGSAEKNEFLDWYFKNKMHASTMAAKTGTDQTQPNNNMRDKLQNSTHGYDLRLANTALNRSDNNWNDLRKERMSSFKSGGVSVLKNDVLDAYADLSGVTAKILGTTLDLFKSNNDAISLDSFSGAGFPVFINDKNTTYRHSMEMFMPEGSGIWSSSLNNLSDMVTRSKVDRSSQNRLTVSADLYSETESGYHPSSYKSQGVIGFVWGFADSKLMSWNDKGTLNRPTYQKPAPDGFSSGCPYNYQADSGCTLKGNDYSQKVHTVRNIMVVVNTVSNIATLGASLATQEAVNLAVRTMLAEAVNQAKTALKEKVKKEASKKLDEIKEKTISTVKEQVKTQIDKVTEGVVGGIKNKAESLIKDTFSKGKGAVTRVGSQIPQMPQEPEKPSVPKTDILINSEDIKI